MEDHMRFPLTLALIALTATGAAAQEPARNLALITVTGEGRVSLPPDMATITLGVSAEATTAREAMDQTSAGVAALLDRLAAAGIERRDLQTAAINLNPVWDHRNSGTPRITGFAASNTILVRVRALDTLGGVLDAVLEAGGNTFHGLAFGLQSPEPHRDAARSAAVQDARRKAELLAEAAGVTLGPIAAITEGGAIEPPRPMFRMQAEMASDAVPIAEGEVDVTAHVTVGWEIGG
jgi:uncharacterized protein